METQAMPTQAVAVRHTAEVQASIGEVSGEISGIKLCYAKPTYGVGKQNELGFDVGTIVIQERYVVATKDAPVPIVIVGVTQVYKDWLGSVEFNAGIKPKRYLNEAEARASGKRMDWVDDPSGVVNPATGRPARLGPQIAPIFDVKILIRKPDKVLDAGKNEVFPSEFFLPIGAEVYCLAVITMEKMAYLPFFQLLQQSRVMAAHEQKVALQDARLHRWLFTLGTQILPSKPGRKSALIPEIKRMQDPTTKRGALLGPDEVAELENLLGALTNAQPVAPDAVFDDANP